LGPFISYPENEVLWSCGQGNSARELVKKAKLWERTKALAFYEDSSNNPFYEDSSNHLKP